jgi:hypothetical protein
MAMPFNQNADGGEGVQEPQTNDSWLSDKSFIYSTIGGIAFLVVVMIFVLVLLGRRKRQAYVTTQSVTYGGRGFEGASSIAPEDDGDGEEIGSGPSKKRRTAQDVAATKTEADPKKAAEYMRKLIREDN